MGIFDRFRNTRRPPRDHDEGNRDSYDDNPTRDDDDGDDDEYEDDYEDEPAAAIALVREGHSVPTEQDMRTVLQLAAPECVDLPKTGLNQMRWWREADWAAAGMRQIAVALRRTHEIDPEKTTWTIVQDDRGARVGIVFMRK